MEQSIDKKNIGQFSKQFAKFARKASTCQRLYFVAGARQAGKSVFVGLMCRRELTFMQDTQTMINIIVESKNKLHEYSPIHCDSQDNVAAIQSFLLEQDSEDIPTQIAKIAMIQALLLQVKQISFILIIDDSQKQSALYHIDIFLKLLGIAQNEVSPAINTIKPFTYLIITKVEESLESFIGIFQQLINQTENQNVYELLRFMIDNEHISIIPLQSPDPELSTKMRNLLKLHKYEPKSMLDILSNSTLKREQLSFESINNLLFHLEKIVGLILNMLIFCGGDKKGKQSYEKIAKEVYPDSKNKNKIDMMLGTWRRNNFSSINLSGLSGKNALEQLKSLLNILSAILTNIQAYSPEAKEDLKEIQFQLLYYSTLLHWFTNYTAPAWVLQNANKLIACLNSNSAPEVEIKPQIESKIIIKSKALGEFCKSLQMCKNNGDVLRQCIQRLRQKKNPAMASFQWRIIRDLLQACENLLNNITFLPQLIDFSILMNDDYHCQFFIKRALWQRLLAEQYVKSLIIILHNTRPTLCELLVDYILGVTNSKQTFDNYIRLKASIKMQSHKLFLERQKQQGLSNNSICEKYQLLPTTTYNKIVEKNRDNTKFTAYLQGKDYQQYLTSLQ